MAERTAARARRRARERVVDDAVGSLRAEGLEPSPVVIELARRHVAGELTAAQLEAMVRAYHRAVDEPGPDPVRAVRRSR